jgi:hypothetical protein
MDDTVYLILLLACGILDNAAGGWTADSTSPTVDDTTTTVDMG